jgi:RimJ/RimL family protein N-acetyltransferase
VLEPAGADASDSTVTSDADAIATFVPITDPRPEDAPWPTMYPPPVGGVTLSGGVVEVAQLSPDTDAAAVFLALDDDRVWRHVAGRPKDPADLGASFQARMSAGWIPWVVRLRVPYADLPAGAVVGTSSYLDISVEDARLEIGFTAYAPAVWATAVNPETKLLLLRYAFDELGAGRVQLKTDVRNARSQRAIARLGATYEGTLRRYQRRADGTVRDTVVFSILSEDWPAVRQGLSDRLTTASDNLSR